MTWNDDLSNRHGWIRAVVRCRGHVQRQLVRAFRRVAIRDVGKNRVRVVDQDNRLRLGGVIAAFVDGRVQTVVGGVRLNATLVAVRLDIRDGDVSTVVRRTGKR